MRPTGSKRLGTDAPRANLQMRVTIEEREAFIARAASLGLTVSEWLRLLARHDTGLWEPASPFPRAKP